MIPVSHLSRMGIYHIQIGGVEVKARVINDGQMMRAALAELECDAAHPIVGLDVKKTSNLFGRRRCALLILCTSSKCLIIQLDRMTRKDLLPQTLTDFLGNRSLCFVCPNGFVKRVGGLSLPYEGRTGRLVRFGGICSYSYTNNFKCERIGGVEVGQYAARILKNPQLLNCKSLDKLGSEAGVDLSSGGNNNAKRPKWDSEVFSEEDVMWVMRDAVTCYRIVDNLLRVI